MTDKVQIQRLIDKITSSEDYEGDFGDPIKNFDKILSNVENSDKDKIPEDYLNFIAGFGCGELDPAFYLDDGPVIYSAVFGREIPEFNGMYVFSGNSGDTLYAFGSSSDWKIFKLCSESNEIELVAESFSKFILDILKHIESMIDWRSRNE